MSLKNNISSFTVIIAFLCVSLAGLFLISLLPVKLAPSQSLPGLTVSFSMQGSSSRVVEMEVTSKLEGMLSRIKGVKNIYSRSGNGWGNVTVILDKYTPLDAARFEASTIIRQTWNELPRNVSYPQLSVRRPDEKSNRPFLNYTLNSSVLPITIQNYAENVIKTKLSEIKGIYKIEVVGATPMEWQLEYDNDVLEGVGVTVNDIKRAIQLHYHTEFLGMGEIQSAKPKRFIRVVLAPNIEKDYLNTSLISVKNNRGKMVYLSQLVKVKRIEASPKSYYRINGLNSIYISISAEEAANQLTLSKQIKELVSEIKENLPYGYELHQSYDATEYIKTELDKIYLRSGLTILILLAFVFLISRNVNYLFLIITSLAANLAIATVFYYFFRLEIQLYSLAGITISLSLIIDNTIIMTDHLIHQKNKRIFLPILVATLTTIGALSIIFFLDEKLRLNLQDFAIVIIINLAVSLTVALFFVPAMIDKLNMVKKKRKKRGYFLKRIAVKLSRFYQKVITLLSKRKWIIYVCFTLLFGLPVFMLPAKIDTETRWAKFYNATLGSSFYNENIKPFGDKALGGTLRLFVENVYNGSYFTRNEQTVLSITASMPNGTTLLQMDFLMRKMESYLTTFSEIKQFQTNISNPNRASIQVFFTKEAEKSGFPYQLKNSVITKALQLGGGSWGVYGLEDQGFNNDVRESAGNLKIKMVGYNYDELLMWADTLKNRFLSYRRIKEVDINADFAWYKHNYQEFLFDLNKNQLAVHNISPSALFHSLYDVFAKDVWVGDLMVNGERENIKLHSKQSKLYDIWALNHIGKNIGKQFYKLNQFATISKGQVSHQIAKENQQYKLSIQFNYIGSPQQGNKVVEKEVKKINEILPTGYKAEKQGGGWNWNQNNNQQYWLLALLIVIIFFTTSILFNSLRQPFIIILIIPVSFIGVFFTFYAFELNFDQGGFASFVLLSGITVNASIYILNEYNNIRKKTPLLLPTRAYIKAWNRKITPILLTIISTILGFIPFMVGLEKEAFWFPMAAGATGGLLMSLVGVFVLLPLLMVKAKLKKAKSINKIIMKKSLVIIIIATTFIYLLLGCNNQIPTRVEKVIKLAGNNGKELKKVIQHYSSSVEDSLKLKATYFLIENMEEKYSIIPLKKDNDYKNLVLKGNIKEDKAWNPLESEIGKLIDSIETKESAYSEKIKDIDVITSEYLINNIDKAFEVWYRTKSFTKYSFNFFCEYILPYRIANEPLTDWRSKAYKKYAHLLDSLHSTFSLATEIIKESDIYYNAGMSKYPFPITYQEIDSLHWGSCRHLSDYLLLSLRALGIASSIDVVPAWANRSSGHVWNVIFDSSGKAVDIGFSKNGTNRIDYKISKIYRTTFSNNSNSIRNNWKDVTNEYEMPLTDINIDYYNKKAKHLFLFVFNNQRWVPVALSLRKNNTFLFKNVSRGIPFGDNKILSYENEGKGIVYMPGTFLDKKNSFQMGNPIVLKEDGTVYKLTPNLKQKRDIILHRKYPKYENIDNYAKNMIGGIFELSSNSNFRNSKVIHTIEKKPVHSIEKINFSKSLKGRYIKYTAPLNNWMDAAEITFYYNSEKLKANILKPLCAEISKIYDYDIDTYYSGEKKGESIVFDFEKNTIINSLTYSPRTDGNDIIKGELYELFFWDKKWISLGRKKATKYVLKFQNVPNNSLLLLKNLTKGTEERIFTYENEKQIWW